MARCSKCNRILLEDCVCWNCNKMGGWVINVNIFEAQKVLYQCIYCNKFISVTDVCDGKHKNWLTTLLLAIFLGWIGFHRFYVRKIGTGIIMLLLSLIGIFTTWVITGISLIWVAIDIIKIVIEKFEDREERVIKKYS